MRVATIIAGVVMLGAVTLAQSVNFDFDKTADFSGFRTYAWVRGTELSDPINHTRIVAAVNTQLVSKQLSMVDRQSSPDLLVAYHASFDRDLEITGFSSGWGGFRFPGSQSGTARANEIVTGTLMVDLVDARTRTIVWRGIATREIDASAKPEQREKNINRAAARLFKNYPPAK